MVLPWQTTNSDEVGKPSSAEVFTRANSATVKPSVGKSAAPDANASVVGETSKPAASEEERRDPAKAGAGEQPANAAGASSSSRSRKAIGGETPGDAGKTDDGNRLGDGQSGEPDGADTPADDGKAVDGAGKSVDSDKIAEGTGESSDDSADEGSSGKSADAGNKRPSVADAKRAGSSPASEDADEVRARARKRSVARLRAGLRTHWKLTVVGAVLLVIVAVIGVFSWDRWLRYDDAADFQGAWLSNGTASVVAIDGQTIQLAPDVAYEYTLDTTAKTISFSFADLQGQGRYRFSADRQQLVITDGAGYTWLSTLGEDLQADFDGLVRMVKQEPVAEPTPGNGITVLDRA